MSPSNNPSLMRFDMDPPLEAIEANPYLKA